jgi:glycosyltransferase involved in cell wall biosynthesis
VIHPSDAELRALYRAADAVVFPAEEDFGIVPVEAQACGTPVVAYGRGGALDTIEPGVTGVLVPEQDVECLASGIETVLNGSFKPIDCRRNAERFSSAKFRRSFMAWVTSAAESRGLAVDTLGVAHSA